MAVAKASSKAPPSGNAIEQLLSATDGVRLFVRDWPLAPDCERRGSVLLMHGLGEHCGRNAHIAQFFNRCGYAARTYDHRGHGRSGGARGDIPHPNALIEDAKIVLCDLVRHNTVTGDLMPPLLFGHSLGGLFAARFATGRVAPLRGLILSSPALAIDLSLPQKALLWLLQHSAPGLAIPNGLKTNYLSHADGVEAAYLADPLVHGRISARLLTDMQNTIAYVQSHATALTIPTLMVVAGDDRLVDPDGSQLFFPKLANGIGTWRLYDGFYHELFNEKNAEQVFDDVRNWLTQFTSIAPATITR